ncbi:hypothetical protein QRD02_12495 [Aequorivita sp. SDUM287046]|uniref:Uncharacterized protein n=1 Tax=Aequorivita aurantiaca TaxID=3053356 RepID=A0ABT8DII4_9FLAO|nr:hypothetical protein [Aequorivita aurantiaca]MDN3725201.1 hypothetical protein [Aequorivita aurantiaca]
MKNLTALFACLCVGISSFSQVGINTTEPTSTLDVNGSIRVRDLGIGSDNEIVATQVVGMDEEGNFVRIEMSENIYLENNVLKTVERRNKIGTLPTFTGTVGHNVDMILWPGGANSTTPVLKIIATNGDFNITGFDVSSLGGPAAADGITAWLYSVSGKLELKVEDNGSAPQNRILADSNTNIRRYGMVKIMYDGALQRWLIMSYH